ncbi:MAG: hypothetical protein KTR24_17720 [Saprospiraceae bacterium]|nr:hypothetical protein [Saprospiraceae bacterium]
MTSPSDNPLTEEGVLLGRKIFFDKLLSADFTMSCASCHDPQLSFTDGLAVSLGIDGLAGRRSAPSLLNIGFDPHGFHWDGKFATVEDQALAPIEDPIELHNTWSQVEERLRDDEEYPALFRTAFGIENKSEISRDLAVKAIAQFERTLVSSGSSKWDRWVRGEYDFTDEEFLGYSLFFDLEDNIPDAECGHCHNPPFFAIQEFRNNGLDDVNDPMGFADGGRGEITGEALDLGKFKVPTLRNVLLTAPYMHDGRFENIDQVLEHYNTGGAGRYRHPLMRPLNLEPLQLEAIKSFLGTLTDEAFLTNPDFQDPGL